jgi:hypothetical protein
MFGRSSVSLLDAEVEGDGSPNSDSTERRIWLSEKCRIGLGAEGVGSEESLKCSSDVMAGLGELVKPNSFQIRAA